MRIQGVIIRDQKDDVFFGFVRQFPGICAQGNSIEEVGEKVSKYFWAYVEKQKNAEIPMSEI